MLGGPSESDPGLVRLSVQILGAREPCTVSWTQLAGARVRPRVASASGLDFVARASGRYTFRAVATCGAAGSEPALATVEVRNVAPVAERGRVLVLGPGDDVRLSGAGSSDANGDRLSARWATTGVPAATWSWQDDLLVVAGKPGLVQALLTVRDPAGAIGQSLTSVLVMPESGVAPTAVAAAQLTGEVGRPVTLDASDSVGGRLVFSWAQTSGAPVVLSGGDSPRATFVPDAPGRYTFSVQAARRSLLAPPATVEVLVAPAGVGLPRAIATGPGSLRRPVPFELDGSASAAASAGGRLDYLWRQARGPAAGLTGRDQPVATVVPFEPGSYVFELVVSEAGAPSAPAQLRVDVGPLPRAIAGGPGLGEPGDRLRLGGASSSPGLSGAPLAWRWTQVDGPWTALSGPTTPWPAFTPATAGLYRFELEVGEGGVWSAPATVSVLVVGGGDHGEAGPSEGEQP